MRSRHLGRSLAALTVAINFLLIGTPSEAQQATISFAVDGNDQPQMRTDLLMLNVVESTVNSGISGISGITVRLLNWRSPDNKGTPILYYSDGPRSIKFGSSLQIKIDGSAYQCQIDKMKVEFPVTRPPEMQVGCRMGSAPPPSGKQWILPVPGFNFAWDQSQRPHGAGLLVPGRTDLHAGDTVEIKGAGVASGLYTIQQLTHTFDLESGFRTSYSGPHI